MPEVGCPMMMIPHADYTDKKWQVNFGHDMDEGMKNIFI
jgi:hypothetical protein